MEPPKYVSFNRQLYSTFCSYNMTQSWADMYFWELLLNETKVDAIIELGTAWGGFSLFLSTQAKMRGCKFHTFDCVDHRTAKEDECFGQRKLKSYDLGNEFMCLDVFANKDVVEKTIMLYNKIVLFCDDGNKPKEIQLYGPCLKSGSICCVHDFGMEIFVKDIPEYFKSYMHDDSEKLDCLTRGYIKD